MQKHAAIDALWLSTDVYDAIAEKQGFVRVDAEGDGYKVYEWRLTADASMPIKAQSPD